MNIICIGCRESVNASSVICLSCGQQVPRAPSIRRRLSVRTALLVTCLLVLIAAAGAGFYGLSQTVRLDTAQFGLDLLAALESMENSSTLIPARDACTLLSKQEVEDAIGIPVSQVRSVKNDASHTRCLYLPEGSRMKAVDLKVDWTGGH